MENKVSEKGRSLFLELNNNPKDFREQGKEYDLLQEYYNGYPLKSLFILLNSNDNNILKVAIWIASELGSKNCNLLIDSILPIMNHNDLGIKYFAMECILLGTDISNHDKFAFLIKELDDKESYIRLSAMILISKASSAQIQASLTHPILKSLANYKLHQKGINLLIEVESVHSSEIISMLNSFEPLIQRYAAIAARLKKNQDSEIIGHLLMNSNKDIKEFGEYIKEVEV